MTSTTEPAPQPPADIWGFEPYMQAFLPILHQQIDFISGIPHRESKEVTTVMLARRLANLAYAISSEREGA
jgi:hypothetical protein